jgi:hypothetical protein
MRIPHGNIPTKAEIQVRGHYISAGYWLSPI